MSMWICGIKIKYKKMNVKDFSYIREKHRLMKHLISALTIIAISAFSFQANAQETISSDAPEAIQEVYKPEKTSRRHNMPAFRNEVELSYGRLTLADMAHMLSGAFVAVFTVGYSQFDNFNAYGSVNAEYYRVLNKTFSVGGLVGWSGGSADVVDKNKVKTGTSDYSAYVIMPSTKIFWFRKNHVAMYSKLSAGIMFIDDYEEGSKSTDYSPLFSFQAGAVCVQAGGQRVRGFVELGIGMTGLIVGGISVAF